MCGRYVMARAVGDLLAQFDAGLEEETVIPPSWNVAPTADVPILLERLVDGEAVRQLHLARWGLVPPWARDPGVGPGMINARSESVLEKPAFRKAVRSRRCAVPADGYYEWKAGAGRSRQPYYVRPRDGSPMVFAGLYEWWQDPSKVAGDPGRWLLSASILTTDAPPEGYAGGSLAELTALHERVPLPLDRAALQAWLDPHAADPAALVALVRAGAHDAARGWRIDAVSSAVGNVRNDFAELIQPEFIQPAGSLF